MENFIEVASCRYDLLQVGDFIKWYSDTSNEYTHGATIKAIRITKNDRQNWLLRGLYKYEYTLYWDTLPSVWLKKNVHFSLIEKEIKRLNTIVNFIIAETQLHDDYIIFQKKLSAALLEEDKKIATTVKRKKKPQFKSLNPEAEKIVKPIKSSKPVKMRVFQPLTKKAPTKFSSLR